MMQTITHTAHILTRNSKAELLSELEEGLFGHQSLNTQFTFDTKQDFGHHDPTTHQCYKAYMCAVQIPRQLARSCVIWMHTRRYLVRKHVLRSAKHLYRLWISKWVSILQHIGVRHSDTRKALYVPCALQRLKVNVESTSINGWECQL